MHARILVTTPEPEGPRNHRHEFPATCQSRLGQMYAVCAQHHIPSPFSNVISLCQSPEVDLVSVVTPPYLHAEQMIGALNIGTFK